MKTCIAGCKHFEGGEIKHHKDCPFYPESLSKMYDELKGKQKAFDIMFEALSSLENESNALPDFAWKWVKDAINEAKKAK